MNQLEKRILMLTASILVYVVAQLSHKAIINLSHTMELAVIDLKNFTDEYVGI